jgi:hypothetical protein
VPSHAARRLLAEKPAADGRIDAEIELLCGCVVRQTVARDRIADLEDGRRFPVGKYRCPKEHALRDQQP